MLEMWNILIYTIACLVNWIPNLSIELVPIYRPSFYLILFISLASIILPDICVQGDGSCGGSSQN